MFIKGRNGVTSLNNLRSAETYKSDSPPRIVFKYEEQLGGLGFSYGPRADCISLQFDSKEECEKAFETVTTYLSSKGYMTKPIF